MKMKRLKRFLIRRMQGGHCDICRKFVLAGLKFDTRLICFNCIRLMMMYLGKQFDITFLMTKKPSVHKMVLKSKKKRKMINPFSPEEIREMRGGGKPVPSSIKKPGAKTGFEWVDPGD